MDQNTINHTDKSKGWGWLARLNPVVPRHWLLILAGIMWTGVGVLLSSLAVSWWAEMFSITSILLGILGVGISIFANQFQFRSLARKNIDRILSLNEKACAFSFQAWKGYLIIAVMMTAGILLRSSSIPKPYLAVVYAAIGGALLQASFNYYRQFLQTVRITKGQ